MNSSIGGGSTINHLKVIRSLKYERLLVSVGTWNWLYLQRAFDSVEYPVLLEKLFDAGVNGKM